MPMLRSLTTKIKTKLTTGLSPPSSPTTTSFEVVRGEKRAQVQRVDSGSDESRKSFGCGGVGGEGEVLERREKRRSKFREEL